MDTYRTRQEEQTDKIDLTRFLESIDAAPFQLRLDECRSWSIQGKRGHVYHCNGVFSLPLVCHNKWAWTAAKKLMAFCRVAQDGDEEGVFSLARLPVPEEAETIRNVFRIRRKTWLSDEERERRKQRLRNSPDG
jgi:hypothetical protein